MQRKVSHFITAIVLGGVFAVALWKVEFTMSKRLPSEPLPAVSATNPSGHPGALPQAEPIFPQAASTASTPASVSMKATPLREVRVRAVRDGHDYGWVQLPRGTRVELVRDEGSTLVVRFDQVSFRISRAVAQAGLVVPVPRPATRLAGL